MPQRARESFFAAREDGSEAFVAAGTVLADDDPLVAGRESLLIADTPVEPAKRTTRKTTDPEA